MGGISTRTYGSWITKERSWEPGSLTSSKNSRTTSPWLYKLNWLSLRFLNHGIVDMLVGRYNWRSLVQTSSIPWINQVITSARSSQALILSSQVLKISENGDSTNSPSTLSSAELLSWRKSFPLCPNWMSQITFCSGHPLFFHLTPPGKVLICFLSFLGCFFLYLWYLQNTSDVPGDGYVNQDLS